MKLSSIRRGITATTTIITIGTILLVIGTLYTADHFSVTSVSARRTVTAQGYAMEMTFNIQNAGLYDVGIRLAGRILSAQTELAQNSTNWTVAAGTEGNYTFTIQANNSTAATYFAGNAPAPVFDFNLIATTAYGLIAIQLNGQKAIS